LHAGLGTSFGAGERDWVLRGDGDGDGDGDGEASDVLELRSRVLPLSGDLDLPLALDFGALGAFLTLLVALVTQMTLRQVERWNCTK
jgi:hypothetical protein